MALNFILLRLLIGRNSIFSSQEFFVIRIGYTLMIQLRRFFTLSVYDRDVYYSATWKKEETF